MVSAMTLDGVSLDALSQCTFSRWQPKIGDPNFTGWLTVVFYLITFAFCVAVIKIPDRRSSANRTFWIMLCFAMIFLAVNKQLDLQSLATAGARCAAKLQGWYQDRAAFQIGAILSLGLIATILSLVFLWVLRHDLKRNFLALLGLAIVLIFVVIRAVGFHYVDVLIAHQVGPIRMNNILEVSGLVLISLNAAILLNTRPPNPPQRRRRSKQTRIYRREP